MIKDFCWKLIVLSLILGVSSSCSQKIDGTLIIDIDDSLSETNVETFKNADRLTLTDEISSTDISPKKTVATDANINRTIDLFNGSNLEGWTNVSGGEPNGWIVKDGLLALVDPQNGNDLITKESYANYILTFEWRYGLKCNSGVKYKIERSNGKDWAGLEYQIQDDENVDDGQNPKRKIASLFDIFLAKSSTQSARYPSPTTNEPTGEFREGKIIVNNGHIEHWIDGELVLSFEVGSDEWKTQLAESKFKNRKNFGEVTSSPILLQSHGFPIEFRKVSIQLL